LKRKKVGGRSKAIMIKQHPDKPDSNTYWVVPGKLLAGEYPGARDSEEARKRLRSFLNAGVRHFIDLTEAGELEPYAELLAEEAGSGTSAFQFAMRVCRKNRKPWQRLLLPFIAQWQKAGSPTSSVGVGSAVVC
jgi:hypothetical protein